MGAKLTVPPEEPLPEQADKKETLRASKHILKVKGWFMVSKMGFKSLKDNSRLKISQLNALKSADLNHLPASNYCIETENSQNLRTLSI